ncbi:hypothetical protein OAX78_01340 [Planctomycetota bacterium]|nr:hypothetical protein [Planctomycetota bacterium]
MSTRCAYCHDATDASDSDACLDCGALLHPDCSDELGRCPTLGCAGEPPARSPITVAGFVIVAASMSAGLALDCLGPSEFPLMLVGLFGGFGLAHVLHDWLSQSVGRRVLSAAAWVLAVSLLTLFCLALTFNGVPKGIDLAPDGDLTEVRLIYPSEHRADTALQEMERQY